MIERATPPPTDPHLAIRARPPSPRRLSRKVLLGGAIVLGMIVVAALALGLARPAARARAAEPERAAASGPPDILQAAPAQYGAESFAPPTDDGFVADAPPGAADSTPPPSLAPNPADDPAISAAAAPILFATAPARGAANDNARLPTHLAPPRSPYEVLAGSVIPAALLTELNSDRPGRIIAQVTAPVFDSVTGLHLLIPQGARLIGAYDSSNTHGDRRLMLVWERLILPNGWSIALERMEGADVAGAAGVSDRVDNHLDRIAGAALISAIIGIAANEAEDDDGAGLAQSVGDAAAQEAARTGGRIVDRELSVRPTLRVRAGAPVRVLVTRDVRLRPYRE